MIQYNYQVISEILAIEEPKAEQKIMNFKLAFVLLIVPATLASVFKPCK